MQSNSIRNGIVFGIIVTATAFFSRGSAFFIILAAMTVFLINRLPAARERDFIRRIFLWGFTLRVLFVLLSMAFAVYKGNIMNFHIKYGCPDYGTPYLFDDSAYYTLRALYTSLHWKGVPLSTWTLEYVVNNREYGYTGFVWLPAVYFRVFGFSPVSSRFINCFLGVITAFLVYSCVKNVFGERPARASAVLTAFFPSLFLWSATNLKDTAFIFSFYLMIWAIIKTRFTKGLYYAPVIFLAIWFQCSIRFFKYREYFYLSMVIMAAYFLPVMLSFLRGRLKAVVIVILVASCVVFAVLKREGIGRAFNKAANEAFVWHKGMLSDKGNNYKLLPDRILEKDEINPGDFLRMYSSGIFHVIFEPFPSRINKPSLMLAFLQMCIWYVLIFFAAAGLFFSLKRGFFKADFIFIAYFIVMLSVLAVTGGNVGTIFRMRDVITPIVLIFASLALIRIWDKVYELRR